MIFGLLIVIRETCSDAILFFQTELDDDDDERKRERDFIFIDREIDRSKINIQLSNLPM